MYLLGPKPKTKLIKEKPINKKQTDEKPIDKESIIQSTKHLKVVLEPLDLFKFKHLKIFLHNKPGNLLLTNELILFWYIFYTGV